MWTHPLPARPPPGPILLRGRSTQATSPAWPWGWLASVLVKTALLNNRFGRTEWEMNTHRASVPTYALTVTVDSSHCAVIVNPTLP